MGGFICVKGPTPHFDAAGFPSTSESCSPPIVPTMYQESDSRFNRKIANPSGPRTSHPKMPSMGRTRRHSFLSFHSARPSDNMPSFGDLSSEP